MLSRLLKRHSDSALSFAKKPLFDSERKVFYGRLRRALPKCYIFPGVELTAIMTPTAIESRQRRTQHELLAGRRVDFAVFDARLALLCVIELNAGEVESPGAVSNAELFEAAGIKRFCWDAAALPSTDQLTRMLAAFSLTEAPRRAASEPAIIVDEAAPQEFIISSAPQELALTVEAIEALVPEKRLKGGYPHVWERVCLFCSEPTHLDHYLLSLSVQDRGGKRAGFPPEVIVEIALIQRANARFLKKLEVAPGWQDSFNR